MRGQLNLTRWNKVWLSQPWEVRAVPGTCMVELHGVRGFLTPGDVVALFNLATELPVGGCYLEVGSWLGLSAIVVANGLIANLNFQARIFCVDTWRGSVEHQNCAEVREEVLYTSFLRNITGAQVDGLIQPVRGESRLVAEAWRGPGLDLVFLDGDHSAAGCYQDIRGWANRLTANGRLLGHDAVPGGTVEQAVRRYCQEEGCAASVLPLPQAHYLWEIHRSPLTRF